MLGRLNAALGNETERAAFLQAAGTFLHRGGGPECAAFLRLAEQFELLVDLDEYDVPASHRHDQQNDERAARNEVAAFPQRIKAVRAVSYTHLTLPTNREV